MKTRLILGLSLAVAVTGPAHAQMFTGYDLYIQCNDPDMIYYVGAYSIGVLDQFVNGGGEICSPASEMPISEFTQLICETVNASPETHDRAGTSVVLGTLQANSDCRG